MQNSVMLFTFFFFDQDWSFWANLVQNVKIVRLRWNLIPRLIRIYRIQWCCSLFFIFDWKCSFWANLVQNVKIVSLRWNLIPRLIRISRIQWCCSLFLFLTGNADFVFGNAVFDVRMEYLYACQFWYWELWVENLWDGERKHYFVNFFLQVCF